ncbi:MAG: site-specific integrase [Sulfitobacter sp.]|uniref:tyrosine-type recombinase/integrase n=2 Tax=Pseudomonadota TaxID=1224 RepID=UPI002943F21F|nr:site-specific integrase [Sulfitobacter sp. LC.270.F.C4]WOI13546.1 site-specific integrase [Sulfitobacter sp. LC.270.F.C4]
MSDITIGRLRGGYCVSWHEGGKRRRYQLKARTRKEAEAEARDRYLKETVSRGGHTVADLWRMYVDYLGDKPTAATMGWTGKAVLAHFGALRPDQITLADSRGYIAARTAAGRKLGSIHTELGHLRSCLNWAVKKAAAIDRVPPIEMPSKPDSDVRPLSQNQIHRIVDNCAAPHVRLAVILLLTTGGRVSAVLDRTWDKIDFDRGVIDLRLTDGVTRKGRAVLPMNSLARTALKQAYDARQTEWVVEYNGGPIKSIRTGYAAALRRAGLSGIRIHQIRHTVAVQMLAAGQPIERVSQYLGHSNIQITQKIYARFLPEHLSDAADVLNFGMGGLRGVNSRSAQ